MGTTRRFSEAGKNGAGATFALMANGVSGPWHVDVDESTAEGDKYFAQIEGPSISLSFQIPSPQTVTTALQFLERPSATRGTGGHASKEADLLRIGSFGRASVNLVWDDEFADRCFLVVGVSGPSFRLTLGGEDIRHLCLALRQVQEDLGESESSEP